MAELSMKLSTEQQHAPRTTSLPRGPQRISKVGHFHAFKMCPNCEEYGGVVKLHDEFQPGHEGCSIWCYKCGHHE